MQLSVSVAQRPWGLLLEVSGELDIATILTLRAAVDEAFTAGPAQLVVDLSATTFLDSTGAGELMRAGKRGSAARLPVALVVPPDNWRVRRVIDFMQFGELLPVHDDASALG